MQRQYCDSVLSTSPLISTFMRLWMKNLQMNMTPTISTRKIPMNIRISPPENMSGLVILRHSLVWRSGLGLIMLQIFNFMAATLSRGQPFPFTSNTGQLFTFSSKQSCLSSSRQILPSTAGRLPWKDLLYSLNTYSVSMPWLLIMFSEHSSLFYSVHSSASFTLKHLLSNWYTYLNHFLRLSFAMISSLKDSERILVPSGLPSNSISGGQKRPLEKQPTYCLVAVWECMTNLGWKRMLSGWFRMKLFISVMQVMALLSVGENQSSILIFRCTSESCEKSTCTAMVASVLLSKYSLSFSYSMGSTSTMGMCTMSTSRSCSVLLMFLLMMPMYAPLWAMLRALTDSRQPVSSAIRKVSSSTLASIVCTCLQADAGVESFSYPCRMPALGLSPRGDRWTLIRLLANSSASSGGDEMIRRWQWELRSRNSRATVGLSISILNDDLQMFAMLNGDQIWDKMIYMGIFLLKSPD